MRATVLIPHEALIKFVKSPLRLTESGCAEWTGPQSNGYGIFLLGSQIYSARRAAAAIKFGSTELVPTRVEMTCRSRLCCHPDHIRTLPPTQGTSKSLVSFESLFAAK